MARRLPAYQVGDEDAVLAATEQILGGAGSVKLIGVGPLVTANLRSTHRILVAAREMTSAALVVGGPLCAAPMIDDVCTTYLPVDAYVAGDGEEPIVSIWNNLQAGRAPEVASGVGLPGRWIAQPHRTANLDDLELPARDLLPGFDVPSARRAVGSGRATAAFLSRGCPYSCTFCAAPLSSGRKVRRLSPHRVTDEIRSFRQLEIEQVIFYDDCLFIRSAQLNTRILEFCEALSNAEWTGTFQLELRCDAVNAMSESALQALQSVGCRQVNMGIEKGHLAQLKQFRKRLLPEQARDSVDRLVSTGIRAAGTFIVGGAGETMEDIDQTIKFACSLNLDFAHFNPLAVYPGTQLFSETFGHAAEWLPLCLDDKISPMGDILWRSADMPLSAILDSVAQGYRDFYTTARLSGALARAPRSERAELTESYEVLAVRRPHSWDTPSRALNTDGSCGVAG